jgi:hypothetical protein
MFSQNEACFRVNGGGQGMTLMISPELRIHGPSKVFPFYPLSLMISGEVTHVLLLCKTQEYIFHLGDATVHLVYFISHMK